MSQRKVNFISTLFAVKYRNSVTELWPYSLCHTAMTEWRHERKVTPLVTPLIYHLNIGATFSSSLLSWVTAVFKWSDSYVGMLLDRLWYCLAFKLLTPWMWGMLMSLGVPDCSQTMEHLIIGKKLLIGGIVWC